MKTKYATRTVLLDKNDRVAVINVRLHKYYKIPGGGVEDGEDLEPSAKREVLEESGCACEIIAQLGRIETDILEWEMHDVSDGFIARVIGEKKLPEFETHESDRGFCLEWHENLTSAIRTIKANVVSDPDAAALQFRDLEFLRLAEKYLDTEKEIR